MKNTQELLCILADGRFHSGTELGAQLGISRAAVWKQIQRMTTDWGLTVSAVRGRGYKLLRKLELLDSASIRHQMPDRLASQVHLETVLSVDSTNRRVMDRALVGAPSGTVCFAEHQTAGRGRRGREWVSPFGTNVYCSLLWRWPEGPASLAGLSLAVGVAVARSLEAWDSINLQFKWPNDLLSGGRKLGGVLLDVRGEESGPCIVVIGIGLNICMPDQAGQAISQPWVDLESISGRPISRNRLAGKLVTEVVKGMEVYRQHGLAAFRDEWQARDRFRDHAVELHFAERIETGIARGIDDSGALLLDQGGQVRRFLSGEISLRSTEMGTTELRDTAVTRPSVS